MEQRVDSPFLMSDESGVIFISFIVIATGE
jgi:hypothetical protein